jgi:hypothetical protein
LGDAQHETAIAQILDLARYPRVRREQARGLEGYRDADAGARLWTCLVGEESLPGEVIVAAQPGEPHAETARDILDHPHHFDLGARDAVARIQEKAGRGAGGERLGDTEQQTALTDIEGDTPAGAGDRRAVEEER